MAAINFIDFHGNLDIQVAGSKNAPSNSPVILIFTKKEKLSQHNILKRFASLLRNKNIHWIRPVQEITKEWFIDLNELRYTFEVLEHYDFLNGNITIEPEYILSEEKEEFTEEVVDYETQVTFRIKPDDIFIIPDSISFRNFPELKEPLNEFRLDHPNGRRCGFIMMKFDDTRLQKDILEAIKEFCHQFNIFPLRADDKYYSDELLTNIRTYMHGCNFGIAIFERLTAEDFNPNVSLEIGYMMALRKPILYLKEKTLKTLQSDLVSKLYEEFDCQNLSTTLPQVLEKWFLNKGFISGSR